MSFYQHTAKNLKKPIPPHANTNEKQVHISTIARKILKTIVSL